MKVLPTGTIHIVWYKILDPQAIFTLYSMTMSALVSATLQLG